MDRTFNVNHTLTDPDPISNAIPVLDMVPVLQWSAAHPPPRAATVAPAISVKQWALMSAVDVNAIGSEVPAFSFTNGPPCDISGIQPRTRHP